MTQDLRHALRILIQYPGFTIVAVLTLAVGIGANTAIFSVVNGVLLRPLPYPEPNRIVQLWEHTGRYPRVAVANPNFLDWRMQSTSFDALAAYSGGRETVLGGHDPVFADVYTVTEGFFRVLGVEPALGRTFAPEEMRIGGAPAIVVSYGFWETTLGANPDLAALRVKVADYPVRVVGVMPPGFSYPADAEVWVPKELFPDGTGRTGHNLQVIGRLEHGVTLGHARTEMDLIAARLKQQYGSDTDAEAVTILPLHEALTGRSRDQLLTLLAAVGLVLLIACVNVASTLLARGEERRKELAIRAALGADRTRLLRQLLTENLLLALTAAVAGLLLAGWLVRALLTMYPAALPRSEAIGIDVPVLLFALALAVLTPLVFGVAPSMQLTRTELRDAMAEGSRGSASPFRARVRNVLVTIEVALALLLLVGSALLIRSFWNVVTVHTGFDARGVVTAEMALPGTKYSTPERAAEFYSDLLVRMRAVAGVRSAGLISDFPFSRFDPAGGFYFEGDRNPRAGSRVASYRVVSGDYFTAMGIPLLKGRLIADSDGAGRETVVVVNQDFVSRYLGTEEPLGKRFKYFGMDSLQEPFMTIVGVVGNVRHASLVKDPVPEAYVSYLQRPRRTRNVMTVAVRLEQPALAERVVPVLRETLRGLDPDVPVEFSTFENRVGQSVTDRRFTMVLLGSFAGIALLLSAIGVYGVLTYSVAQRTQEIGIRMALGADARSVIGLMLRGAFSAVGAGLAIGVAGAVFATRLLSSFLFHVDRVDPLAFTAAVLVLTAVAWAAGYIPARRATRVDPLHALRVG